MQNIKKSKEPSIKKRANFGHFLSNFWANENFPKLACCVSFNYLSTLNYMQNFKKYRLANPEKTEGTEGWTNKLKIIEKTRWGGSVCV